MRRGILNFESCIQFPVLTYHENTMFSSPALNKSWGWEEVKGKISPPPQPPFQTKYSQTDPLNTNTLLLGTVCFVPGESKPSHIFFSKFNLLNTDNPLVWTLSMAPLSVRIDRVWQSAELSIWNYMYSTVLWQNPFTKVPITRIQLY